MNRWCSKVYVSTRYYWFDFQCNEFEIEVSGCMNCRVRISTSTKNQGDDGIESEYELLLKLRTEQF